MTQSKTILIPDDDHKPIITQPKRTTFYIIINGKVVKRPNVVRYKHLTTQFGPNKGYNNMLMNIRGTYNTGQHLIIIEWDTIKIINDGEVVYRCYARTKEKFLSFQQRYWFHIGIPFVYYMNRITDEDKVFFFYPPVGERTEWDITGEHWSEYEDK